MYACTFQIRPVKVKGLGYVICKAAAGAYACPDAELPRTQSAMNLPPYLQYKGAPKTVSSVRNLQHQHQACIKASQVKKIFSCINSLTTNDCPGVDCLIDCICVRAMTLAGLPQDQRILCKPKSHAFSKIAANRRPRPAAAPVVELSERKQGCPGSTC